MKPQLSLFAGPVDLRPSATFGDHETHILDAEGRALGRFDAETTEEQLQRFAADGVRVRVRLRVTGEHDEPSALPKAALTVGECATWEEPCRLYACRHRLDDAIEERTRRALEDEDDDYGNQLEELSGPRLRSGAYWSRTRRFGHGQWCALRVAAEGGIAASDLGAMFGLTRETARQRLVESAVEAYHAEDIQLNDTAGDLYGDEGRHHTFVFDDDDSTITSAEAKRAVVPGEEPCTCEVPMAEPGKRCATCSKRVKRGRMAPRVRGYRRPKKDPWVGVARVIPPEFAERVDVRNMNSTRVPETPAKFRDIKAMLAARAARKAAA